MALQALASFEAHQDKGDITDLVVTTTMGPLHHNFHINQTNKLLLQSTPISSVPTTVTLDMVGDGCALIQVRLKAVGSNVWCVVQSLYYKSQKESSGSCVWCVLRKLYVCHRE